MIGRFLPFAFLALLWLCSDGYGGGGGGIRRDCARNEKGERVNDVYEGAGLR